MTQDASLPPNAPMTNGTLTPNVHGEADASSSTPPQPPIGSSHPRSAREEDDSSRDQKQEQEQEHSSSGITTGQSLREVCAEINSRVEAFLAVSSKDDERLRNTQYQTRVAIGVIEKALEDYEFEHLSLSYNGGKDCLVLLILYLSVLHTHFTSKRHRPRRKQEQQHPNTDHEIDLDDSHPDNHFPTTIPSIYAKPPDPFPLVTSFVEESSSLYHLDLVHISTNPGAPSSENPKAKSHSSPPPPTLAFPSSTTQQVPRSTQAESQQLDAHSLPQHQLQAQPQAQLSQRQNKVITFRDAFSLYLTPPSKGGYNPLCKAIFVGTRRTDPHGKSLSAFQMTDGLWPRFMRIHPVLDFSLGMVWSFLRHETIRYGTTGARLGEGGGGGEENSGGLGMITYCEMYDQGYTSLGGVGDTHRNPKLIDHGVEGGYKPAWTMTEDEEERAGRE